MKIAPSKLFICLFVMLSVLVLSFSVVEAKQSEHKRVIAQTHEEVTTALDSGCSLVQETKRMTAFLCDDLSAAALELPEDIRVQVADIYANEQIGADSVQKKGKFGTGRTIVVLDTGYNYKHPELASSYAGGRDFVNFDNDPADDNGHGSHVAGLITSDGIQNNSIGVAPDTRIVSGKVLDSSGRGYLSTIIAAIYWAIDGKDYIANSGDEVNADAISISIGTYAPYAYNGTCDTMMPQLTEAIKYARSKGTLVVIAAGNNGGAGVSIPGCVSYATTVGAVDSQDNIAIFSGIGNAVDIAAPGVSLLSAWLGSNYATQSGTSMATPIVSGTIALIKEAHPEYTADEVEQVLLGTANDSGIVGKDNSFGFGIFDAYKAVKMKLKKLISS